MDIRQMEIFVSVVDNKGFLACAEKLHVSQSTVSAHIAALEQELKTRLIRRTTRSFEITPEGERFYIYATDILALQKSALDEFCGEGKGMLRIGSSSVPSQCVLPGVLSAYLNTDKNVRCELTRLDSLDVIERVCAGGLDVGFVGTQTDASCDFFEVARDRLVLACPNTEEYKQLAQNGNLAELVRLPFLVRENRSGTQREAARFLKRHGILPEDMNIRAHIDDEQTLRLCVAQGMGAAIISYSTIEDSVRDGRVIAVSLGDDSACRSLFMVFRKSGGISAQAKSFVKFAKTHFGRNAAAAIE